MGDPPVIEPPIFGLDADGVAAGPIPNGLAPRAWAVHGRHRRSGSLDALQRRAVGGPGLVLGRGHGRHRDPVAAPSPGRRGPRPMGPRGRAGGSVARSTIAAAAVDPPRPAATRTASPSPGRARTASSGRSRNGALAAAVGPAAGACCAGSGVSPGDRVGHPPADAAGDGRSRSWPWRRIGAIFTPIFSGYGAPAIASRLADCEATLLITADGFLRRGSWVDLKSRGGCGGGLAPDGRARARRPAAGRPARRCRGRTGGTLVGRGGGGRTAGPLRAEAATRPLERRPTDPETPYMIIYTSGTTGRPKGAVHVHGGFPIKAAQDLAHTLRPAAGRPPVLVHRPRLDDGAVGDRRRRCCSVPGWSSTRAHPTSPDRTGSGPWSPATA